MLSTDNRWAAIDDIAERLCSENRANIDKLTNIDYDDILPHLIKSIEPKYLPSIDAIDPEKLILNSIADFIETGDEDHLFSIVDTIKNGVVEALKGRITNILDAKLKEHGKSEESI